MDIRIATWADVESVLARLSEQHQEEYRMAGWPSEAFMARMAAYMTQGDTKCLWFDGQPQAVLSIRPGHPYATTWLAVTREFFDKGVGPTKVGRKYMRDAVACHGPILSIIGSKHPDAGKWMQVIGFRKLAENIFLFA